MTPSVHVVLGVEERPSLLLNALNEGEAQRLHAWLLPHRDRLRAQVDELLEEWFVAVERGSA